MTSKGILTVTSVATALMFGGGLYLYMNFGSIAKQLAQDYASRTLGVDVSIGRLAVSFQDRKVAVTNVKIGNPPGYKNANAVKVARIDISAGALGTELLEFKDVSVKDVDVYLEVTPQGTNLTDIRNNLNTSVGETTAASETDNDKKSAMKVIVDKLLLNGTVHPSVSILETNIDPIALPTVNLSGIGRSENGVVVGQAIGQIWTTVVKETMQAAQKQGYLNTLSEKALDKLGVDSMDGLKGQLQDKLQDKVKGLDGDLGGGLKKLFE